MINVLPMTLLIHILLETENGFFLGQNAPFWGLIFYSAQSLKSKFYYVTIILQRYKGLQG